MTITNRPLRVFLCHAPSDKSAAQEFYQKLRAESWINPWLDEENLLPGQDWRLETEKAVRAADVVLKERRRLVVMPRETPLHVGHCKLLYEASQMGVIVFPPMPVFYNRPRTIDDMLDATIGRVLDLFGIDTGLVKRWSGVEGKADKS